MSYAAIVRSRWKLDAGSVLIGSLSASYANAGNLGIAVAAFVVGDTTVVVPTLLVQMMVVQPIALMVLDRLTGRGVGVWSTLRRLTTNPLTIASVVGVTLAVTGWELPRVVDSPIRLLSGLAIPAMLMSYGAALRLSPWPGKAGHNGEMLVATVLKMLVMPVVAWLAGTVLRAGGERVARRGHHGRAAHRAEHLPARHALPDRGRCCPRDHPRDDALLAARGTVDRRPARLTPSKENL